MQNALGQFILVLAVLGSAVFSLPLRAQEVEGRPVHEYRPAAREVERREEVRPENRRLQSDKRFEENQKRALDEAAKKVDLTQRRNAGGADLDRALRAVEADRKTEQEQIKRKVDATLDRIARGENDPHWRDGSVFHNNEGKLPQHEDGYYKEYVYRGNTIDNVGRERVVVGRDGDVYYTSDHYENFSRIR